MTDRFELQGKGFCGDADANQVKVAGKAALVSRLLPTLTGGRGEVLLAAVAAELGMTEGAVKMAASRLRKRYGEILREEIARTVANPADVEDEVRALFAALAR